MLFAERARKTGNTAKEELLKHLAEEAALAEIVRSDVDNLEDASRRGPTGSNPCIATLQSKLSPRRQCRWRSL